MGAEKSEERNVLKARGQKRFNKKHTVFYAESMTAERDKTSLDTDSISELSKDCHA
jgi:hypothetical protein